MKRKFIYVISLFTPVYLLFGLLLFLLQQNFIYFPTPNSAHQFPTEIFKNEGESIEVIVLNSGKKNAILYFGGNAESVAYTAPDYLKDFPSHSVYLVNYRGYGGSSGSPEEKGIYSDALHIFNKIRQRHTGVSVIGRSLGSGVATYLASKRDVKRLVLVTPFDSIQSIAQDIYPVYPISLLLKDKYNSEARVQDIKANTLILIAENDQVIPRKYTTRLINAFPPIQLTVETINNSGHNDLNQREKYHLLLREFIE